MIKIYLYGCECGVNGHMVRKVKAYGLKEGIPVEVINTKYDRAARQEHADYLGSSSSYPAIVVKDNTVTRLNLWHP